MKLGDTLISKDNKHRGTVVDLSPVYNKGKCDLLITIDEDGKKFTDSVNNFYVI
jgi:hypothetical protein